MVVRELSDQVGVMLDGVGSEGARTITPRVDMQYTGQGYVIEVEFPDPEEPDLAGTLRARFEHEYAAMYGYSDNTAAPRVTAITVTGVIEPDPFELPENLAPAAPDREERRDVYFPETAGYVSTAIHRRDELPERHADRGAGRDRGWPVRCAPASRRHRHRRRTPQRARGDRGPVRRRGTAQHGYRGGVEPWIR